MPYQFFFLFFLWRDDKKKFDIPKTTLFRHPVPFCIEMRPWKCQIRSINCSFLLDCRRHLIIVHKMIRWFIFFFCVNESTRCTPDAPYDSDTIKLRKDGVLKTWNIFRPLNADSDAQIAIRVKRSVGGLNKYCWNMSSISNFKLSKCLVLLTRCWRHLKPCTNGIVHLLLRHKTNEGKCMV